MSTGARMACLALPAEEGRTATPNVELAALWDVAFSFSPRVEVSKADACVFVDIAGLARLFESEAQVVQAMRHAAEKMGIAVCIGVGSGKAVARIFAAGEKEKMQPQRHRDTEEDTEKNSLTAPQGVAKEIPSVLPRSVALCVSRGESYASERERMAGMPIRLLRPSDAIAKVFWQWGLRTIGDLARLPRKEIEARLGCNGILLHRLACAEDDAPLVPTPAPETLHEAVDFDCGLSNLEPLTFVMRGLLDRLAERLLCRGLAASEARVVLTLVDRRRHTRTVGLAAPTRDAKTLLDLIRLDLAEHPPDAEIEALAIDLVARVPRPTQLGLFEPKGPSPERLATTLARLSAMVGRDRVGAPALVDAHRPEAFALVAFGEEMKNMHHRATEVRRDFTEEEVFVAPHDAIKNSPSEFPHSVALCDSRGACFSSVLRRERTPDVARIDALKRRIADLRGPFRLVGEWWATTSFARDYYDATLCDGSVIRLYRDLAAGSWVIDGLVH